MIWNIVNFASAEAGEKTDLLGSLGIDVQLLVLQSISFLLLLFILSKYVFPVLSGMLDKREKLIKESIIAAHDAEKNAEKAKDEVARLLKDARNQADEVMANAKTQATQMVEIADKKSHERAERIVAEAGAQITKDVAEARNALRKETLQLVAEATEKVVGKMVDVKLDQKIVESVVREVEK